ncbi:hypothetical protein BY996DRAFT_4577433 [Phakopsora pachyrhizi]|nr:hypothetical protein BY996DRAFT_4577433 [Phakopsora pachyrhizi]
MAGLGDVESSHSIFGSVTSPANWSEHDVKGWLQSVGYGDLAQVSEDHGLDGTVLLNLDFETLKDLGISKVGRKLRLLRLISQLDTNFEPTFRNQDGGFRQESYHEDLDSDVWTKFNWQNHRIKALEDQIWELKALTQTLRERTDSLVSFNSSWALQSSMNSSKLSVDSSTPTEPVTASPAFLATPASLSAIEQKSPTALSSEFFSGYSSSKINPLTTTSSNTTPRKSKWRRSTSHPELNEKSISAARTIQAGSESQTSDSFRRESISSSFDSHGNQNYSQTASINNPWNRKPSTGSNNQRDNRQSTHSLIDLRRKFSASKLEGTFLLKQLSECTIQPESAQLGLGIVVGRKPSLIRRDRSPLIGLGRSVSQNNHNQRSGLTAERLPTDSVNLLRDLGSPKDSSSNFPSPKFATSKSLSGNSGISPKFSPTNLQSSTETSIRVKANSDQTVIEVLSNHLSNYYANDPHVWSKHVLIVRIRNMKEHCLSYDDIPLKVYRNLRSREGVDFAIRSIDELPSPLRMTSSSRRKDLGFCLEDELALSDKTKNNEETDSTKTELESQRVPLSYGLAICGYQAESPDELNIKPGESFNIKSHSGKRYFLEKEGSLSLSPNLSLGTGTNSPSPSLSRISSHAENSGWVPESYILESTKSIRLITSNESSLKHLISRPIVNAAEHFDVENLTLVKVALISHHSQSINWSGELMNIEQGEKLRAFKFKTRSHWTYCMRESNGERGWFPNWILSSNLQLFPLTIEPGLKPLIKLQSYLLQQQHHRNTKRRSNSSESGKFLLARSASSATLSRKPGLLNSNSIANTARDIKLDLNSQSRSGSPASRTFASQYTKGPMSTDFDGHTTPDEISSQVQILHRSATVVCRARNFAARKRRSRINPIMEK